MPDSNGNKTIFIMLQGGAKSSGPLASKAGTAPGDSLAILFVAWQQRRTLTLIISCSSVAIYGYLAAVHEA